ncbi:hypothetical protein VPH35_069513 [Triticum aestivum]
MAAVADVDHYEVLRLPSGEEGEALSVEQIDKAYRAQSRLRHPDKRSDDPAATADFQGLVTSYRLLRDESLRRQFDARRGAAARAAATGVKRRRAVSDLEERERAFAARARAGPAFDPALLARREDKRKAADVKRELEDFFRKSVASGSASTSAHGDNKGGTPDNRTKTDKGKVLKVSWEGGADYYTAAKLDEIFRQFGEVEDIVIKTRKPRSKGSAIVVMASKVAANHSVYNVFPVPLMVAPIEELVGSPAFAAPTSEPRASNVDGTGFSDMEASVFRKLQEAQKRKQCA